MPDKVVVSRIATPYMFLNVIIHVGGAALGIYALMTLAGDALPGWQIAILERSMFFVPLFVLFEQFMFIANGAIPRTTSGVLQSALPMVATIVFSYAHFGNWMNVALDLSMPMLGVTGLAWLLAGIGFPIIAFLENPGGAAIGIAIFFLLLYAMFVIPAVGVLISLFTYTGSTIFAGGVTNASIFLLLSMIGIILSEGYRYATALGAFGDDE